MKTEQYLHRYVDGWDRTPCSSFDSPRTLILLFGSSNYLGRTDVFEELERAFPKSTLVGCSGGGVFLNDDVFDDALIATVLAFDSTDFWHRAWIHEGQIPDDKVGELLGKALTVNRVPQSIFLIADGFKTYGERVLRGLQSVGLEQVKVWGGMAGDGSQFRHTWVYCDHKLAKHGVVAVAFSGSNVRIRCHIGGGWKVLGPKRTVTASNGCQVFAMDNRSVLEIYHDYLGELACELPAIASRYPLMVESSDIWKTETLRSVVAIDRRTQSMRFAGEIPEGSIVQMMRGDLQSLLLGASEVAREVSEGYTSLDKGIVFACNCIGRRMVLGQQADLELEAVRSCLPEAMPMVGFYSMGEIAPFTGGDRSGFFNETLTLTSIVEEHGPLD